MLLCYCSSRIVDNSNDCFAVDDLGGDGGGSFQWWRPSKTENNHFFNYIFIATLDNDNSIVDGNFDDNTILDSRNILFHT